MYICVYVCVAAVLHCNAQNTARTHTALHDVTEAARTIRSTHSTHTHACTRATTRACARTRNMAHALTTTQTQLHARTHACTHDTHTPTQVEKFLRQFDLDLICRAHQVSRTSASTAAVVSSTGLRVRIQPGVIDDCAVGVSQPLFSLCFRVRTRCDSY